MYISKVFKFASYSEKIRNVNFFFENSENSILGEIDGALALRISQRGKQQVLVVVSQDNKQIKQITLQKFKQLKSGNIETTEEHSFSFFGDEFEKLIQYLKAINFIDFSNFENFQIEDLSTSNGNKVIYDIRDRDVIEYIKGKKGIEREELLEKINLDLNEKDINILLGRKKD